MVTLCIVRGGNLSKLALGISLEAKAELNTSSNVVQNDTRMKLLITTNDAIVAHVYR